MNLRPVFIYDCIQEPRSLLLTYCIQNQRKVYLEKTHLVQFYSVLTDLFPRRRQESQACLEAFLKWTMQGDRTIILYSAVIGTLPNNPCVLMNKSLEANQSMRSELACWREEAALTNSMVSSRFLKQIRRTNCMSCIYLKNQMKLT